MIRVGMMCGGPELDPSPVGDAFSRVVWALPEETAEEKKMPAINVAFHVSGSAVNYASVVAAMPSRLYAKQKTLLVKVLVPGELVHDVEKSTSFMIDALRKANVLAAEAFARKKGLEPFDLAKAQAIVDESAGLLVARDITLQQHDHSIEGY